MSTRRSIIANQPNIMAPANMRRRLTMHMPRTVIICRRRIQASEAAKRHVELHGQK